MQKRDSAVDILRVIGIFLIISAHCSFANIIYNELRSFDVIMMIFISGIAFSLTFKENYDYFNYVKKRFFRLVFPIWVFLAIYFIIFIMILKIPYSAYTIITSFLLLSGINYVWIFRVFFVNALISPLLKKISNHRLVILLSILMIITNDILYMIFSGFSNGFILSVLELLFNYSIGYGAITLIGINWKNFSIKEKEITFFMFLGIFIFNVITKNTLFIQQFKYPPQGMYLSYGMLFSIFLYQIAEKVTCNYQQKCGKILLWFSKNSMKIYLAHIIILNISVKYFTFIVKINGWPKFIILIVVSSVLVAMYDFINGLIKKLIYK